MAAQTQTPATSTTWRSQHRTGPVIPRRLLRPNASRVVACAEDFPLIGSRTGLTRIMLHKNFFSRKISYQTGRAGHGHFHILSRAEAYTNQPPRTETHPHSPRRPNRQIQTSPLQPVLPIDFKQPPARKSGTACLTDSAWEPGENPILIRRSTGDQRGIDQEAISNRRGFPTQG